jgi:hypothetical protein
MIHAEIEYVKELNRPIGLSRETQTKFINMLKKWDEDL